MKARYKRFHALPLALVALSPVAACAAGRWLDESPAPAASSPAGVIGTFTYVDALRPTGRARGDAAEQVATRTCDHGNSNDIGGTAFDACMLARGWRFESFEPTPPGAYLYDDVVKPHGQERGDAVRQAATRACNAGDTEKILTPRFDDCMRARGCASRRRQAWAFRRPTRLRRWRRRAAMTPHLRRCRW